MDIMNQKTNLLSPDEEKELRKFLNEEIPKSFYNIHPKNKVSIHLNNLYISCEKERQIICNFGNKLGCNKCTLSSGNNQTSICASIRNACDLFARKFYRKNGKYFRLDTVQLMLIALKYVYDDYKSQKTSRIDI